MQKRKRNNVRNVRVSYMSFCVQRETGLIIYMYMYTHIYVYMVGYFYLVCAARMIQMRQAHIEMKNFVQKVCE